MNDPADTPSDAAARASAGVSQPGPRRGAAAKRARRALTLAKVKGATEPAAGGAECRYVAVIMDGNGRWARKRRLPVAAGHKAGARALRRVLERGLDLGIREVTAFAFSTENWNRPEDEVHALMDLFVQQIESQVPDMHARGARIRFVGSRRGVPNELGRRIDEAEALTARNERMTLYIAFNYGARQEILDAAAALAAEWAAGAETAAGGPRAAAPPVFSADALRRHLYAPEMHDPELLVRTSGEQRVSNFLLWQIAYTELFFSEKLWPDFGEDDLDDALAEYARRQRRFGGRS